MADPSDTPSLALLPTELLRLVAWSLELPDRVRLTCTCKALQEHQGELLGLAHPPAIHLRSWSQGRELAGWLRRWRDHVRRLVLVLPPLDALPAAQGAAASQPLSAYFGPLWEALSGSTALTSLAWDFLFCEQQDAGGSASGGSSGSGGGAALGSSPRSFPTPLLTPQVSNPSQMLALLDRPPPDLPALQRLSMAGSGVCLPASYSSLASLKELSVAGQFINLARGCLPPGLLKLTVDWRREGYGYGYPSCRHFWEVAQAAVGAPRLAALRLLWCRDQPLNFHGLEQLSGLTSLALERGYLRGLPPQLSALGALRELAIKEVDMDTAQFPAGSLELAPLSSLTRLLRLRLESVDFLGATPAVTAGIWQLPGLQEVVLTGARWRLLNPRWPHGIMSVNWSGGIPDPGPTLEPAQQLTRLTLDLEAALDNVPGISAMATLEHLTLFYSPHAWRTSGGTVGQLAAALQRLPRLRRLEVRPAGSSGEAGAGTRAMAPALGALGKLERLAESLAGVELGSGGGSF